MTLTTAVTDGYRIATDRLAATDWTRLAAAVVAVQLATALWWLTVEFLLFSSSNRDVFSFSLGLSELTDPLFLSAIIGTFLAPVLVVAFFVCTRVLPIRRLYAQTAVPWLVLGPGSILAAGGYALYDWGFEATRAVLEASGWQFAEWAAVWLVLTTLLVAFVGVAYTLATGSVRPTDRQRRGLVVAVAVLVAVPMVAGAAFPIDEGNDASSFADDREPTPDPADYDRQNVSLGEVGSANHLLANETDAPPGIYPNYNVTDTHVGPEYFDLRTYEVNDGGEWVTVDGQYYLSFEGPANRSFHREQVATTRTDWEEASDGSFAGMGYGAPDSIEGELRMADIKSMWVTYDVIHDNGDVHRYQVKLERDDVSSDA